MRMANQRKKNRRRKTLSAILVVLALLIAGAAVGVKLLRQRVTEAYGEKSQEDVQTAAVTRGSISTTITGSGTLAAQETTEVSLPTGVALRSLPVAEGDTVAEGDILAYLDLTSLMSAMNERQTRLSDLDEEIRLNGQRFRVVGVLKDDDASLTSAFRSGSLVAYIPYSALIRISASATAEVTAFYVSAGESVTVDEARERLTEILKDRFDQDEDAFILSSQNALESAMSSVTSILAVLLGGIAAISLVVGGIMNIMLVTVTERTREIGIRKAVGASRGMILTQFLVEAVVICMLGCALGILGSWGVLRLITTVVSGLNISFQMSGSVVLIAVLFCFFIGIVFGLYPANKAARMAPIDALHYGG